MEYLFDSWKEIKEKVNEDTLILSDYDGTLTPIVKRPELAVLSKEMKKTLKKLSDRFGLAIISGRSLEDMEDKIGMEDIIYAGNHGMEIENNGKVINPKAKEIKPIIHEICNKLSKIQIRGTVVEDKGLTASLHYRLVDRSEVENVEEKFNEIVHRFTEIKTTRGKKVLEVRPDIDWDKGKACEWIINRLERNARNAIYLGDDKTDEDGFDALEEGITILVAEEIRDTNAKYYLKNVKEVKKFFTKLLEITL